MHVHTHTRARVFARTHVRFRAGNLNYHGATREHLYKALEAEQRREDDVEVVQAFVVLRAHTFVLKCRGTWWLVGGGDGGGGTHNTVLSCGYMSHGQALLISGLRAA